jgi:adenylate cyclase
MPRLECRPESGQTLSFELSADRPAVLGRAETADLRLDAEPRLSRRHAELALSGGRLRVRRLPEASNPIFKAGTAAAEFEVEPGDYFVIGKTRFWFYADGPRPVKAQAGTGAAPAAGLEEPAARADTLSKEELYSLGTVGPTDRLRLRDLLELPGLLRLRSRGDFYGHVASLLRHATGAQWACACAEDGTVLGQDGAGDPSRRLSRTVVAKALAEAPRPTLYRWDAPADYMATSMAGVDWAICAAAAVPGEPARVFYAAGAGARDPADLRACAQFVGLVGDTVSRAVSNDRLQDRQGRLQRFFAAPVVEKVIEAQEGALTPRAAVSTVMFFDIRQFSKMTERQNEEILRHVQALRAAMTAMTEIILRERGVVLSYLGDGILACWNVPFAESDHVDRACRAALDMGRRLSEVAGWRCGIGMHSGEVVAGALGSDQIFSYSLIGAVVNQASRIEGLTKLLEVPVIVTEEVARALSPAAGSCSRLGRFIPAGMDLPLSLFALRGPGEAGGPQDRLYEEALACFERGDWDQTLRRLGELPADHGPAKFLAAQCIEKRRYPPEAWDGVIRVTQK